MRDLSHKIFAIPPSATIEISDTAKRMRSEGIDVISLSIGEPDFATPPHITQACVEALVAGETHYAPSAGIPELRSAIAEKISGENGFDAAPEEVIVSCGAKNSIYEAMEAVLNAGDEVVILDPAWVSYDPCVIIAGGKTIHHPLHEPSFQVDDALLERIGPSTRMIVINTPSNPSGTVLNASSLGLIKDICEDHDLIALSDEIYEKLIYEHEHLSLASMGDMHERTITINGFSKAYAMTGWRIGYAVAPAPLIHQMIKVQQHTISHPTTFAMWGALAALEGDQGCVEEMRVEFDRRRRFVLRELASMGYQTAPAEGAFYAFVRVEGDDLEMAQALLSRAHVAVTPGTAFYAPGWLRLSYAADYSTLEEAMRRIGDFQAR
jgi:aspartate aminotransferase